MIERPIEAKSEIPRVANRFEHILATVIGERPCALCGLPRGYGQPVIHIDRRVYHPACGRLVEKADARCSP